MFFWRYLMKWSDICQNVLCNGHVQINFEQKDREVRIKLNIAIYDI